MPTPAGQGVTKVDSSPSVNQLPNRAVSMPTIAGVVSDQVINTSVNCHAAIQARYSSLPAPSIQYITDRDSSPNESQLLDTAVSRPAGEKPVQDKSIAVLEIEADKTSTSLL